MTTQTLTSPAEMTTPAELLARYNELANVGGYMHKDAIAANEAEMKALAIQILEGDLTDSAPTKGQKIASDTLPNQLFIQPIAAPKAGKLTPQKAAAEFVSTDTLRPAMCGVRMDAQAQAAVATCGHRLAVFPCSVEGESVTLHPKTFEVLKAGDKISRGMIDEPYEQSDRYPDYQNVIPLAGRTNPAYIITDIQALRDKLAGICRASRFVEEWTGILAGIYHGGEWYMMQPEFVAGALRALQATGATRLQLELSTPNRAILFRDMDCPEKIVLVMPVIGAAYAPSTRTFCELLNTEIRQAAMPVLTPAKRKAAPKKPATPRAVRVLNAEEKNSLASELKDHAKEDADYQEFRLTDVARLLKNNIARLRTSRATMTTEGVKYELANARIRRAFLAVLAPTNTPIDPPTTLPTTECEVKEDVAPTSPALSQQNPLAFTHKGVGVYHVRKNSDDPTSRLLNYWYLLSGQEVDVRELPTYVEPSSYAGIATEARRALELAIDSLAPPTLAPEPEPVNTAPAPRLMSKRNPFSKYIAAGHAVKILHQVGKAAVATIRPHGTNAPFYCVRYRHHYAETFNFLSDAFATVRAMREAELAKEAELLTLADTVAQGLLTPAELVALCMSYHLPPDVPTPRAELRRVLSATNAPKKAHYLHVLTLLTSSTKP